MLPNEFRSGQWLQTNRLQNVGLRSVGAFRIADKEREPVQIPRSELILGAQKLLLRADEAGALAAQVGPARPRLREVPRGSTCRAEEWSLFLPAQPMLCTKTSGHNALTVQGIPAVGGEFSCSQGPRRQLLLTLLLSISSFSLRLFPPKTRILITQGE